MSDAITPDPPAAEEDPLAIVPTLAGFLALSRRVEVLESQGAATVPPGDVLAPPEAVQRRLNRHREDIDEIKKRYNKLVRYLESLNLIPGQQPADPSERYQ